MAADPGADARPALLFSVSSLGDLVLATLAFDLAARRGFGPLTVVGAPTAPALLQRDPRVAALRVISSSSPLRWRLDVLQALLEARRARATVVNLEVYPPRWSFVRRAARALRLPALALDLAALRDDNARSARGEPTSRPHRAHHYAGAFTDDGEPPPSRLVVDEATCAAVERRLAREAGHEGLLARDRHAPLERPRVVVHLGSTETARRPPPDLAAATLRALGESGAILPVFVGASTELADALRAEAALPPDLPRLNLCGRLPLAELPALLRGAALFVGGDSGPLKVAEAVGARTLSFWASGATAAAFAGPRGSGHVALPFDSDAEQAAAAARALLSAS